jgi:hypothetical protein
VHLILLKDKRRRFNPNAALGVLATWHGTRGGVYSPLVPDQLVGCGWWSITTNGGSWSRLRSRKADDVVLDMGGG